MRFILRILLKRSLGNKCLGEDIVSFYNRYPKWKIVQDWLFKGEYGIIYKKRYRLVKPLSKLLPKQL